MTAPGPDMGYQSETLRSGGGRAGTAADAAQSALGRLRAAAVRSSAFGEFAAAGGVATGLSTTRDGYARTSHDVHAHHLGLQARAQLIAAHGDRLVSDSSAVAHRGGTPGAITDAMGGPTP